MGGEGGESGGSDGGHDDENAASRSRGRASNRSLFSQHVSPNVVLDGVSKGDGGPTVAVS